MTSLRFMLDGERIKEDSTPKMLELDDNDQIDCLLAQVERAELSVGHHVSGRCS